MNQTKTPLTFRQAMTYLNISSATLYRYVKEKQIPCYRPTGKSKGNLYFAKEELENFLFSNRQATHQELDQQANSILNKPRKKYGA